MAKLLRMPEVAANATEAVLQEWLVNEHDAFAAHDAIVTVETEKAVVDVEAAADGVLLSTLVPAGSRVEVGAPIALLGDPGEQVDDLAAALDALGVTAGAPALAPELRLVPDDPEGGTADTGGGGHDDSRPAVVDAPVNGARIFTSPLARRLAQEAGVALGSIRGSGPSGRIVKRDVEQAIAARRKESAPAPGYTEIPHSGIRRATAARLTESKQTAPHFYLRASVMADRLLELREQLNEGATVRISLNDMVIKAAARAHAAVPEMNVIWTADAVRAFSAVDISVAVATDRGLLTPVLRGVQDMSISAVATSARDLAERARSGKLRQSELEGGTLSITNLGMYGTEEFAGIINPPQAAILAVGAARLEPVVREGRLSTGMVMRVTLSVDHRPVDGTVAARWLQSLVDHLEHPVRILA